MKWSRPSPPSLFSEAPLREGLALLLLLPLVLGWFILLCLIAVSLIAKESIKGLWQKAYNAHKRRRVRLLCRTPQSRKRGS